MNFRCVDRTGRARPILQLISEGIGRRSAVAGILDHPLSRMIAAVHLQIAVHPARAAAHGRRDHAKFGLNQITEYVMNGFHAGPAFFENISGLARQRRHIAA